MNWNKSIRQTHRWLSIVFTVAVIINGVAVLTGRYSNRLGLLAVLPLFLLLFTGLYLFALPYAGKWRRARRPLTPKFANSGPEPTGREDDSHPQ